MHRNHQRRFIRINPDYSIDFNDKAQRVFFTRPEGISGLYLNRDLSLSSGAEGLADSDDAGRVVVVNSAEGAQNFLAEYVFRLKEELKRANEFNEGIVREAIEKLKR
jgi:hypothetical protein